MIAAAWRRFVLWVRSIVVRVRDAIVDHWLGYLIALLVGGAAAGAGVQVVDRQVVDGEELEEIVQRTLEELAIPRLAEDCDELTGCPVCFCLPSCEDRTSR